MYPHKEFTEKKGRLRASFTSYRRNPRGGLDITMTVIEEDKHVALDLVDGGDLVNMMTVFSIPRDE
jgi:hypothetical protein